MRTLVSTDPAQWTMHGVLSNPPEQKDILNTLKQFTDKCKRSSGMNPCTDNTYDDTNAMIKDVIASKQSQFLSYSEVMGQVLDTDPGVAITKITAPPLGGAGYLPMYTDALVANRNSYNTKTNGIKDFIQFYTSLRFRHKYAFCGDMNSNCIRCVLPANSQFYYLPTVLVNRIYTMLHKVITTCICHTWT